MVAEPGGESIGDVDAGGGAGALVGYVDVEGDGAADVGVGIVDFFGELQVDLLGLLYFHCIVFHFSI